MRRAVREQPFASPVERQEGLRPPPDDEPVEVVDDSPPEDDPAVPFDFSEVSFSMPDPERDAELLAQAMRSSAQVTVFGTVGDDSFFDAPEVQTPSGDASDAYDREWT